MGSIFGFLFGGKRAGASEAGNEGDILSRTLELAPFDKIDVSGAYTVVVRPGTEFQVRLTAKPAVLEVMTATVEDGWLILDLKRPIFTSGPSQAEVTMPDLTQLTLSGAAELTHKGIDTASLSLDLSGAADVTLAGKVAAVDVRASGAAELRGSELTAASVRADLSGAASARLRVTTALDVETSGASSFTCLGQPTHLRKRQSGASSIHLI